MCGEPISNDVQQEVDGIPSDTDQEDAIDSDEQNLADNVNTEVIESVLIERQSRITLWLFLSAVLIIACLAVVVFRFPASTEISFIPTETGIPSTVTLTPSWTPLPSGTYQPSETPTITLTPFPSETPREPRSHSVAAGETMFGLGLRYGVSSESIALTNRLAPDAGLFVSQQLVIPWPTATPPLVPVQVEIAGQVIVADPTDCVPYEIKSGDTLLGVASRNRIDYRALLAANRLTEQSILQPGDEICIPKIIRGGVLPPTPGPSPTATSSPPPAGPHLLLPAPDSEFGYEEDVIILQWVTVKDLDEDEWYMVEVTDLSEADAHPNRGFARQTTFTIPDEWWPTGEGLHRYRWLVSIVRVTGIREDGQFIYTFGGSSSEDSFFFMEGNRAELNE
jgi:LysM repeat protein